MHAVARACDARVVSSPGFTPDEVHDVTFTKPPLGSRGYNEDEVDAFLDEVQQTLRAGGRVDVDRALFHRPPIGKRGYDEAQVDAFLARLGGEGDFSAPAAPASAAGLPSVGAEQPFVTSRGWLSRLRGRG